VRFARTHRAVEIALGRGLDDVFDRQPRELRAACEIAPQKLRSIPGPHKLIVRPYPRRSESDTLNDAAASGYNGCAWRRNTQNSRWKARAFKGRAWSRRTFVERGSAMRTFVIVTYGRRTSVGLTSAARALTEREWGGRPAGKYLLFLGVLCYRGLY